MQNSDVQKTFMQFVNNCFNDTKRDVLAEVKQKLKDLKKTNFTLQEVEHVLDDIAACVKSNKKIKNKPSKPRMSPYHAFLKTKRSLVQEEYKKRGEKISPQELTKIVSQAWKDVTEEEMEEYVRQSQAMKEEYEARQKENNEKTEEK